MKYECSVRLYSFHAPVILDGDRGHRKRPFHRGSSFFVKTFGCSVLVNPHFSAPEGMTQPQLFGIYDWLELVLGQVWQEHCFSPKRVLTILILLYPIALATWWRLPNRLMYCVVHHIDSFTQVLPSSSLACVWSVLRRYHSTKASRQCCFFLFEPVWLVGMWQSKLQIRNLFLPRISRTSEMRSMKHHGLARKKSCLDAYHKKLGFGWREHENQTKMRH